MIHYHGTPITPRDRLQEFVGRHFCVSFYEPRDVEIAHEIGQSVMLDNGAYSFWKLGGKLDTEAYYEWLAPWIHTPTTWAVIPDVIDGGEADNDDLLNEWPFPAQKGAPVWHMHESLHRLHDLAGAYRRVCIGSSADFVPGSRVWHARMEEAFERITYLGVPFAEMHMLRAMNEVLGGPYPFYSADSTNITRHFKGDTKAPPRSVAKMLDSVDGYQTARRWHTRDAQLPLLP